MVTNWQIGDRIQNRWQIHKILKGGMGIVHIVYDHEHHNAYAVKTFQDEIFARSHAIAERFAQEALTWIKLDFHQNITEARFVETIVGKPYLFLEYVPGGDLSGWVGTPRLTEDLPQVLRFAIQFCDGMTHALSKGVTAHRDIKPQNCLITEDHTLKVTDFGLAKVFDEISTADVETPHPQRLSRHLSRTGVAAGTCTHMAPEQFDDAKHVDVRADIYSFGVMLYQMVIGKLPFVGQTWAEFERLHKTESVPPLRSHAVELGALVQRCLAKDPARRDGNFDAVREELVEVYTKLTGKPVPEPMTGASLSAVGWNNKGVSLKVLRRFEEAIECYDLALERNRHDERIWCNRGDALNYLERYEEAIGCQDRALELNPRYTDAWTNKGLTLDAIKRHKEAIACHHRALELNPRSELAWSSKGVSFTHLRQYEQAIACYDQALKLNPRFEPAWTNKGNVLSWMELPAEALSCYDHAIEINPHHENPWYNRGIELHHLSRYEEAIACYDRALEINPRYAEAWSDKGAALSDSGRAGEALACYDQALHLNPNDDLSWSGKGAALGKLGQLAETIRCCDRALKINPGNSHAWHSKGVALANSGQLPESLACFEEAQKLGHSQADQAIAMCRQLLGS